MTWLLLGCSAGLALAWIPLLIKFFRSWRARNNPVSLAICVLVLLAAYVPIMPAMAPTTKWLWVGLVVIDSLVCGFFYASLALAGTRFRDTRTGGKS